MFINPHLARVSRLIIKWLFRLLVYWISAQELRFQFGALRLCYLHNQYLCLHSFELGAPACPRRQRHERVITPIWAWCSPRYLDFLILKKFWPGVGSLLTWLFVEVWWTLCHRLNLMIILVSIRICSSLRLNVKSIRTDLSMGMCMTMLWESGITFSQSWVQFWKRRSWNVLFLLSFQTLEVLSKLGPHLLPFTYTYVRDCLNAFLYRRQEDTQSKCNCLSFPA